MQQRPFRPRRSVLYVPASNEKALSKIGTLSCDAVVIDLEDAVAPDEKEAARERLRALFAGDARPACETAIRVNALSSRWGTEDLLAARACLPDAIVLPKVDGPDDIVAAGEALEETDAPEALRLWAMVETPRAVLEAGAIAALGRDPASRLDCFVAGTNDLAKETRVSAGAGRHNLLPWLMQMVLAARAGGLDILDGVSNDFRDLEAFAAECGQGAELGFEGKTLIHPAQIAPANAAFAPSREAVAEAGVIVAAFARPENAGKGVISLDGRMVERLHLEQAERLLAVARAIEGGRE